MPIPPFMLPANGVATPESISRRRRMAEMMMQGGLDTSPVGHWTQGAARMAQALAGGWGMRRAEQVEAEGRSGATQKMIQMLQSPNGLDPTALAEFVSDPYVDSGVSSALLQRHFDAQKPRDSKYRYFEGAGGDQMRIDELDPNAQAQTIYEQYHQQAQAERGFLEDIAKPGGYKLPELGEMPAYTPQDIDALVTKYGGPR